MIAAVIAGVGDPEQLAALAHRRIKATPDELREALRGRVTRHHRFLLSLHLQQIDAIDKVIGDIDQEVDAHIEPFRTSVQLLTAIPGVDALSACAILAEIGGDMSSLPDRRTPDLLGRPVPAERRKRWQAALHPDAQGCRLAQNHPRPMRRRRRPQEGQLPAGAIPSPARPPRSKKGVLRRRRLHPHRRL
jgi:hypothetical protein